MDALANKTALQAVTECYFRHSTNVRRHGDRSRQTTQSLVVISHCPSLNLARQSLALLHDMLHGKIELDVAAL
jgi:hypothetical protein